jgi:hypothetical protein
MLVAALMGALPAGAAVAQVRSTTRLPQVSPTTYEYRDYYAQDPALREMESGGHVTTHAEDEAARAAPGNGGAANGHPANGGNGCENGCENGCDEDEEDDVCRLFDCCWLEERNITIAGWVAQNPFTWNPQSPSNRFNGPVTWTDRSNEYQLNQLYWYAERATDTEGYGFDIGGRVDLLYGTDARFTVASGLDDSWISSRFYGLAMPQLFLEPAAGDWKVKLGHWYSPVGYEVVPTTGNFFSTLPYTFQYGEPFTHTGLLATYGGWERLSLGSGFIRGWDNWGNANNFLGYIGTATYTAESGNSAALVIIESMEPTQSGDLHHRHLQTLVFSFPLSDAWTYVIQSDLGIQNQAMLNTNDAAWWYGVNQYLFYKVSDYWTWGIRMEWFRDQQGFRVGGFLPDNRGLPTDFSGYAGNFTELTFGANWKPNSNLVVRPCIRWDTYNGEVNNPQGLRPFDDGTKNWQILVGGDVILLY